MSFAKHLLWSVVVSLVLVGTGCGDDGGGTPDAAPQQQADASAPADAPAGDEADAAGGDQADASNPTADAG